MAQRIYRVDEQGAKSRLVRATSAPQALQHVTQPRFVVKAASPDDIATLMDSGVKVEKAQAEPAA